MKSVLTVIGTRPEAIKLAPVLIQMNHKNLFHSKICVTRQHTDLLDPLLVMLGISPHYQLENKEQELTLHQSAARIFKQFEAVLHEAKPDLVMVQGDTTSAFTAALAAFYACIPVAHVEAGLRTGHLHSPWPEEAHRCLIEKITTYFFAPTAVAKENLLSQGVSPKQIWVVGNTSMDAVRLARKPFRAASDSQNRKIVVTVHRRENQGEPLNNLCRALIQVVEQFSDVHILFFLHANPSVRKPVLEMLSSINRLDLLEPLDHTSFIQLLDECLFVITDSGGIQEEAPVLGKPVLIIRDTTERPEGVQAGTAKLVGTNTAAIIASCCELLEVPETLAAMSRVHYPYGDGHTAEHIVNILATAL